MAVTGSSGVRGAVGRAGASAPGPELCPQTLSSLLQDSGPNKVSRAPPVLGKVSAFGGEGEAVGAQHTAALLGAGLGP